MRRAGPARGAVNGLVLLHGRGGSAADILGLLAHAGLTRTAAAAPEARGNSWWPTSFLAPMAAMEAPLQAALADVARAVATLESEGLPRDRIWLAGFSQGACLALEAYARAGAGLAGVLGLSGGLVGTADAGGAGDPALYGHAPKRFDYASDLSGGRVWVSVHESDPHIPRQRVAETARVLQGLGATVETTIYPGAGHAVMSADLATLRGWLNRPADDLG